MEHLVVDKEILFELMYQAMVKAGNELPKDVKKALKEATSNEVNEIAKLHLLTTLENLDLAEQEGRLACADTGYPLYYIKVGNNVSFSDGIPMIYDVAKEAVAKVTLDAKLRPTMVHPLIRKNPGTNVGYYFPKCELRFDEKVDGLEITAVPKGGGSEIFGTYFRMLAAADGREGIIKFILDCAQNAMYSGKVCPPAIIGIGIGGTSDICMKIAKEAAVLREIGKRHPEPEVAQLEKDILQAINSLGIGPMGFRGKKAALDVHIELAMAHTACLPVAFNSQCSIARRFTAVIKGNGVVQYGADNISWEYR